MRVKTTLNAASLPAAINDAVKNGYSEENAERVLTIFVNSRFLTGDPGDEHEETDTWEDEGGTVAVPEYPNIEDLPEDQRVVARVHRDMFVGFRRK